MITESEILEQISKSIEERKEAMPDDDPYSFTTRELVDLVGISIRKLRYLLRAMVESGDVESTRVYRKTISGTIAPTPAYRFKIN